MPSGTLSFGGRQRLRQITNCGILRFYPSFGVTIRSGCYIQLKGRLSAAGGMTQICRYSNKCPIWQVVELSGFHQAHSFRVGPTSSSVQFPNQPGISDVKVKKYKIVGVSFEWRSRRFASQRQRVAAVKIWQGQFLQVDTFALVTNPVLSKPTAP